MKNKKLLTCILGALIFATIPFAIKNNNFSFTKKFISAEVRFENESFLIKDYKESFMAQFNSRPTNIGSANLILQNMKTKNFLNNFNEQILYLAKNPFVLKEKLKKNKNIFSNELNNLIYRLNIESKYNLIKLNFYTYNENESELLLKLIIEESEELIISKISSYLNGLIKVLQAYEIYPLDKFERNKRDLNGNISSLKEILKLFEEKEEEIKKIIDTFNAIERDLFNEKYVVSILGQKLLTDKIVFLEEYLLKNKKQIKEVNFYKKNKNHSDFITEIIISLFFGFLITLLFWNLFKKNKKIT